MPEEKEPRDLMREKKKLEENLEKLVNILERIANLAFRERDPQFIKFGKFIMSKLEPADGNGLINVLNLSKKMTASKDPEKILEWLKIWMVTGNNVLIEVQKWLIASEGCHSFNEIVNGSVDTLTVQVEQRRSTPPTRVRVPTPIATSKSRPSQPVVRVVSGASDSNSSQADLEGATITAGTDDDLPEL